MKKGKYYKKLFIAYIIIIAIYALIVVGLFFYKNNEINKYRVNNSHHLLLEQFKNRIDAGFNTAFKLVEQLRLNKNIIHYARSEKIDYYYTTEIFKILNDLNVFYEESGFRISITRLNKNEPVITPEKTMKLQSFFRSLGLKYLTEQELDPRFSVKEQDIMVTDYLILENQIDNSDIITFAKRKQFSNRSYVYFFISFYKSEILNELNMPDNSSFAIVNNGQVLASNFNDNKEVLNSIITSKDYSNRLVKGIKTYKKKNNLIYTLDSNVLPGFDYIFLTKTGIAPAVINNLMVKSLVILLIFILIGLFITFFLTGYLYKPIPGILNSFKNESGNNNDELLFIKNSVSKIRKANGQLRDMINNNKISLKIKFLRELLYGLIDEEEIQKNIKGYNLQFFKKSISVSILEFVNYQELKDSFEKKDLLQIIEHTLIIIEEQLKQEIRCEIVELNSKRFAIVTGIANREKIRSTLNRILSDIETNFEIGIVAAVGKTVQSVFKIEDSFQDAITVLENRNVTNKKLTIAIEDIHPSDRASYFYPLEFERKLIDFVIKARQEEMETILEEILKKNIDERKISGKLLDLFILTLANTIERIFQKANITDAVIKQEKHIYEELESINREKETEVFKVRIKEIFKQIILIIESETEISERTFAEKLINYIHDNYNQDLSLVDLAERFNYSAGYIGKLFKKSVKENFKDYLNKYRVKKAKEIIKKNKNIKIKDVSKMVGCNHINTFLRMFKKYEGISPGQYSEDI